MKKLSNTGAELKKKRCLEKKSLKWIDQYIYIAIKSVKSVK